jgi:glyoxylase-like metal-dependent hydrolase (beta-lactamase superfamily II)
MNAVPMACAAELEAVAPGLFLWRAYDSSIKTELFSTGLATPSGIYLIDPIPLEPGAAKALADVAGIVVTNENHERSAADFADQFGVPIYSAASQSFPSGLTAVRLEGAASGEIAVHSQSAGGVMVIGDALINFEPCGFTFLPSKYCSNQQLMRKSLAKLLDYSFGRMLFAHGTPIQSAARRRLEALLRSDH